MSVKARDASVGNDRLDHPLREAFIEIHTKRPAVVLEHRDRPQRKVG